MPIPDLGTSYIENAFINSQQVFGYDYLPDDVNDMEHDLVYLDEYEKPAFVEVEWEALYVLDKYRERAVYRYLGLKDQIKGLGNLSENWNSYGAEAPSKEALGIALQILEDLFSLNLLPNNVLPSAEGGIGLVFLSGNKQADIEVFNDGDVLAGIYHLEKDTEIIEVNKDAVDEASQKIYEFLY